MSWVAKVKWETFNSSLAKDDVFCRNCKNNFDGVCVNHNSPVGYGGAVESDFVCKDWEASFSFFDKRLNEIEK